MSDSTKPVVNIYTRLAPGDEDRDSRVVGFKVPPGASIDPLDLLDQGFALDGNQAVTTVGPALPDQGLLGYYGPFEVVGASLTDALRETQRELVKYFRERGYEPKFA